MLTAPVRGVKAAVTKNNRSPAPLNRNRGAPFMHHNPAAAAMMGSMMGAASAKPAAAPVGNAQVIAKMRKDKSNHKPVTRGSTVYHSKT